MRSENYFASMPCFTDEDATPSHHWSQLTVLLKNLSVHFQFDLLKLETKKNRDDQSETYLDNCKMNSLLRRILLNHCGDEPGWTFIRFDPQACNLIRSRVPPIPTFLPTHPHPTNPTLYLVPDDSSPIKSIAKKYYIFCASNLLIAEFPWPTSLTPKLYIS